MSKQEISNPLNSAERSEWRLLRTRVKSRMSDFWEQYADLRQIRDEKLYREDFPSFQTYITEELGIEKSHAYRMIDACEVRQRLSPMGDVLPEAAQIHNERQLRELKDVDDENLEAVVERAAVLANDAEKPITASTIRQAKDEILGVEEEPQVEPAAETLSDVEMAMKNADVGRQLVNAIRAAVRLAKAIPDGPGLELLGNRRLPISRHLENAVNEVQAATPKAICPRCRGKKCAQCGNFGWVNAVLLRELEA